MGQVVKHAGKRKKKEPEPAQPNTDLGMPPFEQTFPRPKRIDFKF
jgi:hypothetical protein